MSVLPPKRLLLTNKNLEKMKRIVTMALLTLSMAAGAQVKLSENVKLSGYGMLTIRKELRRMPSTCD